MEVSVSPQFTIIRPTIQLPNFVWMKVVGEPGKDDFGRKRGEDLVISERALNIFKDFGLTSAKIRPL